MQKQGSFENRPQELSGHSLQDRKWNNRVTHGPSLAVVRVNLGIKPTWPKKIKGLHDIQRSCVTTWLQWCLSSGLAIGRGRYCCLLRLGSQRVSFTAPSSLRLYALPCVQSHFLLPHLLLSLKTVIIQLCMNTFFKTSVITKYIQWKSKISLRLLPSPSNAV